MSTLAAHADTIISLAGGPVATGDGYYAYTYNVGLTAGQFDPASNGTPAQFGTVYDFGPLATTAGPSSGSVNSPGSVFISKTGLLADNNNQFVFSFDGTDTPASSQFGIADSPGLTNVRFTYVGSTGIDVTGQPTTLGSSAITVGNSVNNLGTFTVYSSYGTTTNGLSYDGLTYKGTNNTLQSNTGSLSGPLVPSVAATPEPSGIVLLGTGLVGVFGVVRRRLARA